MNNSMKDPNCSPKWTLNRLLMLGKGHIGFTYRKKLGIPEFAKESRSMLDTLIKSVRRLLVIKVLPKTNSEESLLRKMT